MKANIPKRAVLVVWAVISFFTALSVLPLGYCEEKIIKAVEIRENKAVSSATILSKIKTKPGDKFFQEVLDEDIKRLYALGYFTDVTLSTEDFEDGLKVVITVEEKPVIGEIIFKGNRAIRESKLRKLITSAPEEMLNQAQLNTDVEAIKKEYESKGFSQAEVKHETDIDTKTNRATVTIVIDEKIKMKVSRIDFVGNNSIPAKELLKLMATKRSRFFIISGYYKEEAMETDIERIKAYYLSKGFLDVSVDYGIDHDASGRKIYISIYIDEGKKYLAGKIEFSGNVEYTTEELDKVTKMKTSDPFSQDNLRQDVMFLQQFYYHRGYMDADVNFNTVLNQETGRIDVYYTVTENEINYVSQVNIRGNVKTKDIVIRRELRIYPGDRFDGDKIKRSKERLYNLGFFEDGSFDTQPTSEPDKKDLLVDVKETKTGEFSFGGGYSSINQLVGFASVTQRNFDLFNFPTFTGDGQNLTLRAEFGTVSQNYDISWTEPWIFDYPLSFGFDVYQRSHKRLADVGYGFDEERQGGDIRFGKELTDYFRADAVYKLERVSIEDIVENASADLKDEEGSNRLSTGKFILTYDNRDNVFNPTKGIVVSGSAENANKFLSGTKQFMKYMGSGELFISPIENNVFEVSVRLGYANPYGEATKVPIYERFYAGGGNTIRGYEERRVGPTDLLSGDPIGGESSILVNAEYGFPIYEKVIRGAVFYDVGNVWEKASQIGSGDFKAGAGVGVRVKTPIGPVKLDYGYPLNQIGDEKRTGKFYFSVSRGF